MYAMLAYAAVKQPRGKGIKQFMIELEKLDDV